MNKIDLLIGFIIGILASLLGMFLYITLIVHTDFMSGIQSMKSRRASRKISHSWLHTGFNRLRNFTKNE